MFRKVFIRIFFTVFICFYFSCTSINRQVKNEATVLKLDSTVVLYEDSLINAIIKPYKLSLDSFMNEIIGYSERHLFKANPEGLLNNLIADIVLFEAEKKCIETGKTTKVDMALLNNGGLRAPIPEGAITVRHIYELMPFENEIVVLELSAKDTKELFRFVAQQKGVPLSGATMSIQKDDSAGNILITGKPIDENRTYFVATSDYLANGGDKMNFFSHPLQKINTNYFIRDAIIHYIKEQNKNKKVIDSKLDKRIYFE